MDMHILLVAATDQELPPLRDERIRCLVTGPGMVAAAYHTGRELALNRCDLVIHAGIAGAIGPSLHIGETVVVKDDLLFGFGAENGDAFLPADAIGLAGLNEWPFVNGKIPGLGKSDFKSLEGLREAAGITVQTIHGSESSIVRMRERHPEAQVESMEGAAVLYTAAMTKVPCLQLRSISNYVERRNRAAWDIRAALVSLHRQLDGLINELLNR